VGLIVQIYRGFALEDSRHSSSVEFAIDLGNDIAFHQDQSSRRQFDGRLSGLHAARPMQSVKERGNDYLLGLTMQN